MSDQEFYSRPEPSLSIAWARAFLQFMERQDRKFAPFMVSIAAGPGGNPVENQDLRDALDACLAEVGQQSVEVVAKTIFSAAIWRRMKGDRQKLYDYYREHLPDYVAMAPKKNSHGLYFARLIGFGRLCSFLPPKPAIPFHHPAFRFTRGSRQPHGEVRLAVASCPTTEEYAFAP